MLTAQATNPLHCSFCSKDSDEVAKLVAGPGVYICDECVDLCTSIISEHRGKTSAERIQPWDAMDDDELLAHVPRIAATASRVEADLRDWVQELRRRGVTWARIGESLGMTRQSAWERFSGEE